MTVVTASNLTPRWPQIAPPNIYNFKFSWGENPPPPAHHKERLRRSGSPTIAHIWVHIDRQLATPLKYSIFHSKICYTLLNLFSIFLMLCSKFPEQIGSILNPLAWGFSEDTRKTGKGAKTGASHDWCSFYLLQYDWLKGGQMTKVVWLPNETDYSYCEFVVPNTNTSYYSAIPGKLHISDRTPQIFFRDSCLLYLMNTGDLLWKWSWIFTY